MGLLFIETSDEPRSKEELEEALRAVQKEFISTKISPLMIYYTVIMDALRELIEIRKGD